MPGAVWGLVGFLGGDAKHLFFCSIRIWQLEIVQFCDETTLQCYQLQVCSLVANPPWLWYYLFVYSIFLPRGFLNVKDSFVLKNLLIWHLAGDIDIDTVAPNNVWQMSLVSEQALPYMGATAQAMATLLIVNSCLILLNLDSLSFFHICWFVCLIVEHCDNLFITKKKYTFEINQWYMPWFSTHLDVLSSIKCDDRERKRKKQFHCWLLFLFLQRFASLSYLQSESCPDSGLASSDNENQPQRIIQNLPFC